jgi:membrane protein YdbS with pleckstrin-like domain
MKETSEKNQSLWLLTASPVIWAAHFLLSYITASIWCAKLAGTDKSLWEVRVAIVIFTALALIGIAFIGWVGHRRHRYGNASVPHDADTPEDRHRFLGFATLLLSALSAVAVIYAGLVVVFIRSCH